VCCHGATTPESDRRMTVPMPARDDAELMVFINIAARDIKRAALPLTEK
jgi:hypothetical protein